MGMSQDTDFLTVRQAAETEGVSAMTIRNRIARGNIQALRISGRYLIPRGEWSRYRGEEANEAISWPEGEYLGTHEASWRLGVTRQRIKQLIDQGRLPRRLVDNQYVFRGDEIDQFSENRKRK